MTTRRAIIIYAHDTALRTGQYNQWLRTGREEITFDNASKAIEYWKGIKKNSQYDIIEYCDQMFLAISKDEPHIRYEYWLDKWVLDDVNLATI